MILFKENKMYSSPMELEYPMELNFLKFEYLNNGRLLYIFETVVDLHIFCKNVLLCYCAILAKLSYKICYENIIKKLVSNNLLYMICYENIINCNNFFKT